MSSGMTLSEVRVDGILSDLPMREILSRLTLKAQARFKCVSKSWYALITYFQNQDILLKRAVTNEETGEIETEIETKFSFLKYPFTADDESSSYFEHLDYPRFGKEFQYSSIYGHSHGIVCFSLGLHDILLYNPIIGELRKLPPSILLYPNSSTGGIGFGYDPNSRDFKVVRIVDYTHHCNPSRAEVYDLGKDRWRVIETPILGQTSRMFSFDMYYQGFFYWWALVDGEREFIQCFDMSKEVFSPISMPEDVESLDLNTSSLGVLNGSIVLLNYPYIANGNNFNVWEMVKDDHGEFVLWTKLFTFGPFFENYRHLTFVSSHELLMVDDEGQLILCNFFNNQCKQLPIKGNPNTMEASVFVKTLLSVKGGGDS